MKLGKFTLAAILLAPLAGCVSKADLRNANQALELENFHLEQRLNDICWKLQDAQRDLEACRATGATPVYNGGGLTPVAPSRRSSTPSNDPRRPPEAGDVDKPPKIELPDDEPNMPSAGMRKERAPRYNGPPVISPPDPNVPEGILPHSVSSRTADGQPAGPPEGPTYRYEGPAQGPYPQNNPPDDAPRSEPEQVPPTPPAQAPNWRTPNVSAPPPAESVPQPEAESVGAPMPAQMPAYNSSPSPSQAPAPVADQRPESVAAPEPVREPAPAPVGRAMPPAQPENVAAPPGTIDTELRAQPDSRPLVEAEPVVAPHPSTTARPTSAPARPPRQRGDTQAGAAALSMMAMNPKLTVWRHSPNGNSPDDGLTVVVEPRSAGGEMVEVDGDISIVAVDPTLEGPKSKLARWDFKADKVNEYFQGTKDGGGFHFRLEWPEARPTVNRIDVYVRLTVADGRQFVAEYSLDPSGAPLPLDNAPTPAPEPAGAPSEPPAGPPVATPTQGVISRTAAWTTIPDRARPRQSSKAQPAKQASVSKGEPGEWKRAVTPLPAAPQSFEDSNRPATSARGLPSNSPPTPSAGGTAWSPYR